jgi:hypothetical protein
MHTTLSFLSNQTANINFKAIVNVYYNYYKKIPKKVEKGAKHREFED